MYVCGLPENTTWSEELLECQASRTGEEWSPQWAELGSTDAEKKLKKKSRCHGRICDVPHSAGLSEGGRRGGAMLSWGPQPAVCKVRLQASR